MIRAIFCRSWQACPLRTPPNATNYLHTLPQPGPVVASRKASLATEFAAAIAPRPQAEEPVPEEPAATPNAVDGAWHGLLSRPFVIANQLSVPHSRSLLVRPELCLVRPGSVAHTLRQLGTSGLNTKSIVKKLNVEEAKPAPPVVLPASQMSDARAALKVCFHRMETPCLGKRNERSGVMMPLAL